MSAEQYQNLSNILMNSISDDEIIQAVREYSVIVVRRIKRKMFGDTGTAGFSL